jgi:anti-sigma factor RsiW
VLKVKANNEIICGTEIISRFMDNELHGDDLITVEKHIDSCESCRKRLDIYSKIGSGLNSFINAEASLQGQEIVEGVISRIRQKGNWLQGFKELVLSRRTFIPAGVALSIALASLIFLNNPAPAGPSAIISSLSGTGSLTIVVTPETRQTILWVNENG